MKRRLPLVPMTAGVVLALMVGVIVRSVAAGPQTVPTAKDVAEAQRVAVSKTGGTDERIDVPAGAPAAGVVVGNGVIEPADRETKLAASVAGRVAAVLVKEGDHVDVGQVLAELESSVEKAIYDAAEAELAVARAELTRTLRGQRREDIDAVIAETDATRARAELSRGTLERTEALAKAGAATPDELDKARRQAEADGRSLAAAEARRKAAVSGSRSEDIVIAQAKVGAAQARRDQAKAQLDQRSIRSPLRGEVLQVKCRAGELFSPGQPEPLFVVGDTSKLRVRMDVDERDIGKLTVGTPAYATLIAYPGQRFPGRVAEVGRRMGRKNVRTDDPTERIDTKILEVVLELERTEGLVPGLRVVSYVGGPAAG